MIRRNWPLGDAAPKRWLLIKQTTHARISHQLAEAWSGDRFHRDFDNAARQEFLEAVRHHDDGWIEWGEDPQIDPEQRRPYGFTEMPTAASQRIWSDSIRICRELGPLAGWVVASHFSFLQSKQDDDYAAWVDWLEKVDADRQQWLAKWLAKSDAYTEQLAEHCLSWLQAFDWISLWLCCQSPILSEDRMCEPMIIGGSELDGATGWPEITFTPTDAVNEAGKRVIHVSPWPFAVESLSLSVEADSLPVGNYQEIDDQDKKTQPLGWHLAP